MRNILINAFACAPHKGSEPGMAWNWISHISKYSNLYIITEGTYRNEIENALQSHPFAANMHFFYIPVTEKVRQLWLNQGAWQFYYYYKQWQQSAYKKALEVIHDVQIDIIHQLNMIGFREPGYLWKIEHIPFVWGPIGGLKQFPIAYTDGGGLKMRIAMVIKNVLNIIQLKCDPRINMALHRSSMLISAIPDSYIALKKYKGYESVVIPETGCFFQNIKNKKREKNCSRMKVIWAGKFDFRKRLDIAIEAIATTGNNNIIMEVYGTGSEKQIKQAKENVYKLGVCNQVIFKGNCSNEDVVKAMQYGDVFLFTSVSEDTSTVVLEAISNQLPVICFDINGMASVVNDKVGVKIPISTPSQSVKDIANILSYLFDHRNVLREKSDACSEQADILSWEKKALKIVNIYEGVLASME